jgi:predicted ATP-dependent serine protease
MYSYGWREATTNYGELKMICQDCDARIPSEYNGRCPECGTDNNIIESDDITAEEMTAEDWYDFVVGYDEVPPPVAIDYVVQVF